MALEILRSTATHFGNECDAARRIHLRTPLSRSKPCPNLNANKRGELMPAIPLTAHSCISVTIILIIAATNTRCADSTGEQKQDKQVMITSRWEKTIGELRSATLSPDGKKVLITAKDRITMLNIEDGNVLWEDEQYSSGVFGYTANELLVRSRNDISIRVLDVETGKVIRKFECPPNIGIGLQTKDGYFYVCQKRGGRIVRYREGDTDVDLVFDCRTNGEVFGKIRRVPRVTLLYVDEHKCIFTVESRLGIMDLATRKIKAPDQPPLQAYKMLHRSSDDDFVVYTTTADAIVGIDKEGRVKPMAHRPQAGVRNAFVNCKRRLLVYAEGAVRQPAFICVHEINAARTHRIPWRSTIVGIVPDAAASTFISYNGSGQVAAWDLANMSALDNDAAPTPDNRTKP